VLCRGLGKLGNSNGLLTPFNPVTLRCKACRCPTCQTYTSHRLKLVPSGTKSLAPRNFAAMDRLHWRPQALLRSYPRLRSHIGLKSPGREIGLYLAIWLSTAAVSVIIIGIETIRRARRVQFGLAKEMIHSAAEQFLPAILPS